MIIVARIINHIAINLDSESGFYSCSVCKFRNWHLESVIHHITHQEYTRITKDMKKHWPRDLIRNMQDKNRHVAIIKGKSTTKNK